MFVAVLRQRFLEMSPIAGSEATGHFRTAVDNGILIV